MNDNNFLIKGNILSDKEHHLIAIATTFYPDLSTLEKEMKNFMCVKQKQNDLEIEFKNNIYLCNLQ